MHYLTIILFSKQYWEGLSECGISSNIRICSGKKQKNQKQNQQQENMSVVKCLQYASTSLPSNMNAPIWSMSIEIHQIYCFSQKKGSKINQHPISPQGDMFTFFLWDNMPLTWKILTRKAASFEETAQLRSLLMSTLFQISVYTTRQTRSVQHSAQTFLLKWD